MSKKISPENFKTEYLKALLELTKLLNRPPKGQEVADKLGITLESFDQKLKES